MSAFLLQSSAFRDQEHIPSQYTCDGEQLPPPLSIAGVPEGTQSLVLIMDDPDVPTQVRPEGVFDHWVFFNIPPETSEISSDTPGTEGLNGTGKKGYIGPCPPPQFEPKEHRYIFTLYALGIPNLSFTEPPTKEQLLQEMQGHIITQTQLTGRYQRS